MDSAEAGGREDRERGGRGRGGSGSVSREY